MEDQISRGEVGETLVEAGGTRPTRGRIWTNVDQRVGAGLHRTVRPGVLLFPLGPPVLEPNFDLGFGQAQGQGQV